jgi:hypothetical protein
MQIYPVRWRLRLSDKVNAVRRRFRLSHGANMVVDCHEAHGEPRRKIDGCGVHGTPYQAYVLARKLEARKKPLLSGGRGKSNFKRDLCRGLNAVQ